MCEDQRTTSEPAPALDISHLLRSHPEWQDKAQSVTQALPGIESVWLGILIGAFITRGVRDADIRRFVRYGVGDLPFCGCEREVFDTILAAVRDRGHSRDDIDRVIATMTELASAVFRHAGGCA